MVDTASFLPQAFPFKVPFVIASDRKGWDAGKQALILPAKENVMTIIHEAWHYFLSPPSMLKYNDFGLGTSADGYGLKSQSERTAEECDLEEEAVCYFTIATAKKKRLGRDAIMSEMNYSNFTEFLLLEIPNYDKAMKLAKKRNLSRFGFDITYSSPFSPIERLLL